MFAMSADQTQDFARTPTNELVCLFLLLVKFVKFMLILFELDTHTQDLIFQDS